MGLATRLAVALLALPRVPNPDRGSAACLLRRRLVLSPLAIIPGIVAPSGAAETTTTTTWTATSRTAVVAPPPLVEVMRCRAALASFRPLVSSEWDGINTALNTPPFTDAKLPRVDTNGRGNTPRAIPLVGNLLRRQTQLYEAQLAYREGSGAGPSLSSLRKVYKTDGLGDASTLVRVDLDMRDLYRNECLTKLQDMVEELAYLAREQAALNPAVDGADLEEARTKALEALDRYLGRVPAAVLADAAARAREGPVI
jgi:hypothetical protein